MTRTAGVHACLKPEIDEDRLTNSVKNENDLLHVRKSRLLEE